MAAEKEKLSKDIFKGELEETTNNADKRKGFKSFKLKEEVFLNNLPEGISKSVYKAVKNYEREYASAALEDATDRGLSILKKDKDLAGVKISYQFGDQSSGSVAFPIVRRKEGEFKGQKYAVSTINVQCNEHLVSGTLIKEMKNKLTSELCK